MELKIAKENDFTVRRVGGPLADELELTEGNATRRGVTRALPGSHLYAAVGLGGVYFAN